MIVDSSAVIAIVFDEPLAATLSQIMASSGPARISAARLLECYVVAQRSRRPTAGMSVDRLAERMRFIVVPVTRDQVAIARVAYQRFGKGSGHRAGLNFGDCFAYALAKERDEPLLFIGNDFAATDIAAAWPTTSA